MQDGHLAVWDLLEGTRISHWASGSESVSSAYFSQDGKWIVSVADDNVVRLWDSRSGKQLAVFDEWDNKPAGFVRSALVTSDRERLVIGFGRGNVQVWNIDSGEHLTTLYGRFAKFNQDSSRLAIYGYSHATIYNPATFEVVQTHELSNLVNQCAFDPSGRFFAVGTIDDDVTAFSLSNGSTVGKLLGNEKDVKQLEFGPTGDRVVTASNDGTVRVWNVRSHQQQTEWEVPPANTLFPAVSVVDHRQKLLAAPGRRVTAVWDARKRIELFRVRGDAENRPMCAERLATHDGSEFFIWDLRDGSLVDRGRMIGGDVVATHLSHDGQYLCVVGEQGDISIFATEPMVLLRRVSEGIGLKAAAHPQKSLFAVVHRDGSATLWKINEKHEVLLLFRHAAGGIQEVGFAGDGDRLIEISTQDQITVRDIPSGELILKMSDPDVSIDQLVHCNHSEKLLTYAKGVDGNLARWDLESGENETTKRKSLRSVAWDQAEERAVLMTRKQGLEWFDFESSTEISDDSANHVAYAGDTVFAISTSPFRGYYFDLRDEEKSRLSKSEVITIRDDEQQHFLSDMDLDEITRVADTNLIAMTGTLSYAKMIGDQTFVEPPLNGHAGPVSFVHPIAQGTQFLSCSWDGSVGYWDAITGKLLSRTRLDGVAIVSACHAFGKLFVGDANGTVAVLDTARRQVLATFSQHRDLIFRMHCNPTGDELITVSRDGTAKRWNLRDLDEPEIKTITGHFLWAEFSKSRERSLLLEGVSRYFGTSEAKEASQASTSTTLSIYAQGGEAVEYTSQELLTSARFSEDGKQIVCARADRRVAIIDAETAVLQREIKIGSEDVYDAALADNCLVVRHASELAVWDLADESIRYTVSCSGSPLTQRDWPFFDLANHLIRYMQPNGKVRELPIDLSTYSQQQANRSLTRAERERFQLRPIPGL